MEGLPLRASVGADIGKPIYIFAGGGTGGHLYPGLAVAEELLRLRQDSRIVFACSGRDIDRRILAPSGHPFIPQPVKPLPPGPRGWIGFVRAWLASGLQARAVVRDLRPAAVLALGGFAAAPVVYRAGRGVPKALLNPDAVPGKANRRLAGKVEAIFTQFESTREHFRPDQRGKVQPAGCPVRPGLSAGDRAEAIESFGLLPDRKTLLVLGGSSGSANINHAMAALAADLRGSADTWQVLHLTGPADHARLCRAYEGLAVRVLAYCDRMDLAYAAADLAICRGGASTIAELAVSATPAVVVPYPHHRDQHQRLNAAEMVAAGAAVRVEDVCDAAANAAAIRDAVLPLMADPKRLAGMTHRAASVAKPGAAGKVAEWLATA